MDCEILKFLNSNLSNDISKNDWIQVFNEVFGSNAKKINKIKTQKEYKKTKPKSIVLLGEEYPCFKWRDILTIIINNAIIDKHHTLTLLKDLTGTTNPFIQDKKKAIATNEQKSCTFYFPLKNNKYVYSHYNADKIIKLAHKIMEIYDYNFDDLIINTK
jgi:uncharacterized protein YacL (UPF0231 family)